MKNFALALGRLMDHHRFWFEVFYVGLVFPVIVVNLFVMGHGGSLWWWDLIAYSGLLLITGFRYGAMSHARMIAKVDAQVRGEMPGSITWDRNEDTGEVSALVQRGNGEVLVVNVPEESAGSPFSAMQYVLSQLLGIDPEDITEEE